MSQPAQVGHDRAHYVLRVEFSRLDPCNFRLEVPRRGFPEQGVGPKATVAQEVYALPVHVQDPGFGVDRELQFLAQVFLDLGLQGNEHGPVPVQDYPVVTVAEVVAHPLFFFEPVVEIAQVDVREIL